MKYAIIYSSNTGNTKLLAETVEKELPSADCIYCGGPDRQALEADRLYIGFWTDKGTCDANTAAFLKQLNKKELFLFGTAGFGGEPTYYEKILANVRQYIDESNTILGTYMCQGKMPASVRTRYEKMKEEHAPVPNIDGMLANFDRALSHPDEADLEQLKENIKHESEK